MSKFVYKKGELYELIELAKCGDNKALEELIRRVQKNIYTIFSHLTDKKEDISDLTQETLLKMAKSLPDLKEVKSFKYWLNRIITNTFYDFNRKHKEDKTTELDNNLIQELKDKLGCEPGEKCLFSEIEKILKAALMGLPQELRLTIILREFEGMSYEDISQVTNVSLGTVKSRIARARSRLQKDLKEFI